ncbi:hypothetical protein HHK36_031497 [Tetracentron sinense]|uniref:H15 domain-containing protein n=1 Tax=Tetracentron sinense TaxID=13715 RepID=A0A834YBP9_TETSI|nr:hypothetical protein HHK36_031497 [Tetracentron sinense]
MAKEAVAPTKNPKPAKKLPSPLHPPYFQMISEAISSLKDRTGSSQQAIAKFVEEKYKTALPPNFKKVLSIQLRKFAKSERLVKVKNSFKISATEKANWVAIEIKEKQKKDKEGTTKKSMEKKIEKVKITKSKTLKTKKKVSTPNKAVKKSLKTKRLSQVKTPDGLKKALSPKKRKASKPIKSSRPSPKKLKSK